MFFLIYTVYVLYSHQYNKIYIGYTANLQDRILSHNIKATAGWTIVYFKIPNQAVKIELCM
ncbi:MAG TPA: GIY-YIG nuclease family protein [Cyclobacteriaceae bacterium]